jgi:Flp pilus assembly secretin CpaC
LRNYKDVEDIDEDDVIQDLNEMTNDEFESYILQMKKRQTKKIDLRMTTVHAALRMTAEITAISTCIRDVVKALAARFDSNVAYSTVNFLNRFSLNWFNDEE